MGRTGPVLAVATVATVMKVSQILVSARCRRTHGGASRRWSNDAVPVSMTTSRMAAYPSAWVRMSRRSARNSASSSSDSQMSSPSSTGSCTGRACRALQGYTGNPANPSPPANLVQESRTYDPAGRLASVTNVKGTQTNYTYYGDNRLASSYVVCPACSGGKQSVTANGKAVPISSLKPGEKVVATNTKTGKTQAGTIAAVLVHHDTNRYDPDCPRPRPDGGHPHHQQPPILGRHHPPLGQGGRPPVRHPPAHRRRRHRHRPWRPRPPAPVRLDVGSHHPRQSRLLCHRS